MITAGTATVEIHVSPTIEAAVRLFGQLREQMLSASRALVEWWRALVRAIAADYRRIYPRLPGSQRTKRLRKKREAALLSWYQRSQ